MKLEKKTSYAIWKYMVPKDINDAFDKALEATKVWISSDSSLEHWKFMKLQLLGLLDYSHKGDIRTDILNMVAFCDKTIKELEKEQ